MAAAMPEWEALRDLASQIKTHTLGHLDVYLSAFAGNAEKRGAIVHWARDAEEHNRIVYDILNSKNISEIIKSKSMLQEECGMVPFLEGKGVVVTETDLGERIQQLDGQPPAHIVMPAIEKTTEDIAKLFAEKIGTDPNDNDPKSLNEAMRNNARPRFMRAGAGLTGANFAIAEQIYKWRELVKREGHLPIERRAAFAAAGKVFAHPALFRAAENIGQKALSLVPEFIINSKINPWTGGNDREMITLSKETFRDWYLKNRTKGGQK